MDDVLDSDIPQALPAPRPARAFSSLIGLFAFAVLVHPFTATAATVSWNVDISGFWDVGTNWSTGMAPEPGDDVVIDRPSASVTVTFRTGNLSINILTSEESFAVTGGLLDLATTSASRSAAPTLPTSTATPPSISS